MRIISLRHSPGSKTGVVVHARVQSRSSASTQHIVTGSKRGVGLVWRCTCAHKAFHPRVKCDHILAVEKQA